MIYRNWLIGFLMYALLIGCGGNSGKDAAGIDTENRPDTTETGDNVPVGENLFYWNADQFEATSIGPIWGVNAGATIDTDEKHEGKGSMRLVLEGDVQEPVGIEIAGPKLPTNTPGISLYYRWWMKISPSFSWGNA